MYPNINVAEFTLDSYDLSLGDEILVIGQSSGITQTTVNELRLNNVQVSHVIKGDTFTMPFFNKIKPNEKLYKLVKND